MFAGDSRASRMATAGGFAARDDQADTRRGQCRTGRPGPCHLRHCPGLYSGPPAGPIAPKMGRLRN